MRRRDRGHQRDIRADELGQRVKFAGMVHAHLEHAEAGVGGHPRQAQRHADMIVVALHRTVRAAGRGAVERREQRLFGAGLAY